MPGLLQPTKPIKMHHQLSPQPLWQIGKRSATVYKANCELLSAVDKVIVHSPAHQLYFVLGCVHQWHPLHSFQVIGPIIATNLEVASILTKAKREHLISK